MIDGLAVGRIVHYVLESGRSQGDHRPAIVVRDWKQDNGLVNIHVFTDGLNDGLESSSYNPEQNVVFPVISTIWRTSIHYSEEKEPGTWHWPEKA
ncbi:MAG: hypothetical protein H0W02_10220 [Ktedonobacteraceae bacterium]|nr:hypothetical protein [Ktedonobacteraceae bacterium]